MWPFYYAGIYLFVLGARISSLWNDKSRQWISGRKNWHRDIVKYPAKKGFRIWFHVSSLGEFEQARPVIERLRESRPNIEILLTFFSPSGYAIRHNYSYASVFYLPADLPGNAGKWLEAVKPDMAVFVKYDLWPGYLKALRKRNVPAVLISAFWEPRGIFHSWSFPLTGKLLKSFKKIFFQRETHYDYFSKKGFNNIQVSGDTRIDRSLTIANSSEDKIPAFLKDAEFDIVAGSTWPPDEKLIIEAITSFNLKAIIAPHDVSEENILRLISTLPFHSQRLSELATTPLKSDVLVVDSVGLLASLYSLGKIAYVGGGFGKGIHNTLEPLAHGKPVIFGPHYHRFAESGEAIKSGAAFSITDGTGFFNLLAELRDPVKGQKSGLAARQYVEEHSGASAIIVDYLLDSIPFRP